VMSSPEKQKIVCVVCKKIVDRWPEHGKKRIKYCSRVCRGKENHFPIKIGTMNESYVFGLRGIKGYTGIAKKYRKMGIKIRDLSRELVLVELIRAKTERLINGRETNQ